MKNTDDLFKDIKSKYIPSENHSIISQATTYDKKEIQQTIDLLHKELKHQNDVSLLLQNNYSNKDVKFLEDFIFDNEKEVTSQLDNLNTIIPQLKQIILDNKEKERQQLELSLLNEKHREIITKMENIKTLKNDIFFFLNTHNIL